MSHRSVSRKIENFAKGLSTLLVALFLLSVLSFAQISTSGALVAASTTCVSNACVVQPLYNGITAPTGQATIQLLGGFTATVQFEGTNDPTVGLGGTVPINVNALWYPLAGTPSNVAPGTPVTSATAAGLWSFNVAGLTGIRARASAFTSGPLSVVIQASTAQPVVPTSTNALTGDFVDAAKLPYYTPGVTADMCAAITAAATAVGTAQINNPKLYLGGFTGVQFCTAANATAMFLGLKSGGDIYLGHVHLYIDGPCANLACASGYSFNDGDSGGTAGNAPGTPAILVPDRTSLHGMSRRGGGNNNTVIDICVAGSFPAVGTNATSSPLTLKDQTGCVNTMPQRTWAITSTSFAAGTGCTTPCGTLTATVSNNGTSCGTTCAPVSGTNFYINEPVGITGSTTLNNNIVGQATGGNGTTTVTLVTTGHGYQLSSVAAGTGVYTGNFPDGASNALAGTANVVIKGFANAANNGTFNVTASTTTTITTSNAASVVETTQAYAGFILGNCAASCGTLVFQTPVLGLANGNIATTAYVTASGATAGTYSSSIEGVGVGGQGYVGVTGASNNFGNEHTHMDNILCGNVEFFCYSSWGNQAQNGGSFDNFESTPGSVGGSQITALLWLGGPAGMIRGMSGGTFNGVNIPVTATNPRGLANCAVYIENSKIDIHNMYGTGSIDGYCIGDQRAASGIALTNVPGGTTGQSLSDHTVEIFPGFASSDITISTMSGVGTGLVSIILNDITFHNTAGDALVGFYSFDNNGAGALQEISTSELFTNRAGGGFAGPVTSFGNLQTCSAAIEGGKATVTNAAIACTLNSAAAGAGTHRCEVYCNNNAGTYSWIYTGVGQ